MSEKKFKLAFENSDIKKLKTFGRATKGPGDTLRVRRKVLSTHLLIDYVEKSFLTNRAVCDVLVLLLLNEYDLNEVVADIVERDGVDLLEYVLAVETDLVLDADRLIRLTLKRGRVTMAKMIWEYNHDCEYEDIKKILKNYEFVYNKHDNTIDSLILAFQNRKKKHLNKIMNWINLDFWNNFFIKYVIECWDFRFDIDFDMNIFTKNILCRDEIDPGVDDNYSLRFALRVHNCYAVNELLKHPLVSANNITEIFILYAINENWVYAIEKILRTSESLLYFLTPDAVKLMIYKNNYILYLVLKLNIINKTVLSEPKYSDYFDIMSFLRKLNDNDKEIEDNLNEIVIDNVSKPYVLQADPTEKIRLALKTNDIDLAKSIKNYPLSICAKKLIYNLVLYDTENNEVYKYIWDNKLKQYDPCELILASISPTDYTGNITYDCNDSNIFDDIFDAFCDDARLCIDDFEKIYKKCESEKYENELENIQNHIEVTFSKKKYKKFCAKRVNGWSDSSSESD